MERDGWLQAFLSGTRHIVPARLSRVRGPNETRVRVGTFLHQVHSCALPSSRRPCSHRIRSLIFRAHSALLATRRPSERFLLPRQCQRWQKPAPSKPWRNSCRVEWLAGKRPTRPHHRPPQRSYNLNCRPVILLETPYSLVRGPCFTFLSCSSIPR